MFAIPAASAITAAIQALYGVASNFNSFLNEHIESMKNSENTTISRTGRVIEAAKYGFGIGYVVPVVIIAMGQFILGNTLSAAGTIISAATLSNPIAMTCAAVGAIYYGWGALSDVERAEIVERLSKDIGVGVELIKALVSFVFSKMKELLSPENIKEIKRYVGDAAASFGKTLGEVTGAIKDRVLDAYVVVKETSEDAVEYVAGKIRNDKTKP